MRRKGDMGVDGLLGIGDRDAAGETARIALLRWLLVWPFWKKDAVLRVIGGEQSEEGRGLGGGSNRRTKQMLDISCLGRRAFSQPCVSMVSNKES
jgi:hypothetical protein